MEHHRVEREANSLARRARRLGTLWKCARAGFGTRLQREQRQQQQHRQPSMAGQPYVHCMLRRSRVRTCLRLSIDVVTYFDVVYWGCLYFVSLFTQERDRRSAHQEGYYARACETWRGMVGLPALWRCLPAGNGRSTGVCGSIAFRVFSAHTRDLILSREAKVPEKVAAKRLHHR